MRRRRLLLPALAGLALLCGLWLFGAFSGASAGAQVTPTPVPSALSQDGSPDTGTSADDGDVKLDLDLGSIGEEPAKGEKPSRSIVILLGLTVLAVAPSLVIMVTSFTRMIVTLSIARNAVGMQTVPPNQVITGLALFLTLFVMAPVIKDINDTAWQPYLQGELTQSQALHAA